MVGSESRTNRLMWFLAGAVTMAVYLMGPHAIIDRGYDLGSSAASWVQSR
jgi:hypothetical protein